MRGRVPTGDHTDSSQDAPVSTRIIVADVGGTYARLGWIDADGNVSERFKTTEQGAATSVWAGVSPLLEGAGGVYLEDCNVAAPASPDSRMSGVQPHVGDQALAERLWAKSEELTGVAFRP